MNGIPLKLFWSIGSVVNKSLLLFTRCPLIPVHKVHSLSITHGFLVTCFTKWPSTEVVWRFSVLRKVNDFTCLNDRTPNEIFHLTFRSNRWWVQNRSNLSHTVTNVIKTVCLFNTSELNIRKLVSTSSWVAAIASCQGENRELEDLSQNIGHYGKGGGKGESSKFGLGFFLQTGPSRRKVH